MKLATIHLPHGSGCHGWSPIAVTSFSFEDGCGRGELLPSSSDSLDSKLISQLPEISFSAEQLGPVIPKPGKIFCVGLNYREHIEEMGHPIPDHPTLFVKYASALATPFADVIVP